MSVIASFQEICKYFRSHLKDCTILNAILNMILYEKALGKSSFVMCFISFSKDLKMVTKGTDGFLLTDISFSDSLLPYFLLHSFRNIY